jgi:pimeloyl-ACP methyl ester carboxylesterase
VIDPPGDGGGLGAELRGEVAVQRFEVTGAPRRDGRPVVLAGVAVGPADAPAVVLAHGVGSSARFVVAACAAPLVAAGWRLVTYDARGHGASTPCPEPADHHLASQVADLDAVVEAAAPTVAVGGISLGGHAALGRRGPEARVVCLPAWWGPAEPGVGVHAAVAAEVRAVGVAGVIARLERETGMPPWLRETLLTDYRRHDEDSLAAALIALDGATGPTTADLAAAAGPLAVVGWRDDPGHPFDVALRLAREATGRSTLTELAIGDLDVALTRLGDAVVTGLREVL